MSKITRRDFLKTAGVMTLAVAAAGVLSGCEGNTAPVKPETGVKALGDVITVGDYEFTVSDFVLVQEKPGFDPVTGKELETARKSGSIVFALRATKADAKAFNPKLVSIRVNGKPASEFIDGTNFADYGFNKETLGTTAEVKEFTKENIVAAGYTKDAVLFQSAFDLKKVKGPYTGDTEKFAEITKIEVIVNDTATPVYVTYEIPAPAIKNVEKDKFYVHF